LNKKRNARPSAQTLERATNRTETVYDAVKSSCPDYTTKSEGRVAQFLLCGQTNAIPMRDLERLLGMPARLIRMEIAAERMRGVPILSSSTPGYSGYFLAETDEERLHFVRSMQHRANEILKAAGAIEVRSHE
jgi:hypothetical protein